ncbi:uncharacterized protein [Prorops nasuta]|uniref:uncharacterized protein isoform X3 n=1 Tax=Prorops nasuta TaxID=863751 RepID=UPI0034D0095E
MAQSVLDKLQSGNLFTQEWKEKLSSILSRYEALSPDEKNEFRQEIVDLIKKKTEKFTNEIEFLSLKSNLLNMSIYSGVIIFFVIFVFFVYKLFKILSEREQKKEEKKRSKQSKKKK